MKFVIATQELNYLISKCLNIIPQKPAIPILSNILIEASQGVLTLTVTDLLVGIRCTTEVEVLEEGATTLPAKKFSQLVRELTSVNVQVSINENDAAVMIADDSRFRLNGMSSATFPALPDLNDAVCFSIKQSVLKDVLFRTAFAVARDDNRFVLTGVSLQIAHGQATFMGTDGKRLARIFLPLELDKDYVGNFVIPLKAIEEIIKNLEKDENVNVFLMPDKMAIKTENTTVITKLLAGDYPDVNRVIPTSVDHLVLLHREELTTLLRQVVLFTDSDRHVVRFTFSNGELKLDANTMEVGEGNVSMPVNYHGEDLEMAFNPTFFMDVLRHSQAESVTMGLTDPFTPGVIIDQDVSSFVSAEASPLYILMPMRLNEG